MFTAEPVIMLSTAMTSSPRASRCSQMWDPRKPAPPVTRALIGRPGAASRAPHALVLEAAPAHRRRVEEVPSVPQRRAAAGRGIRTDHQLADLVEVEPAEVVPLRE